MTSPPTNPTNWAGNYVYQAAWLHRPETREQVQELVARSRRVKALGSRHSFNDVADTPGDLVSTERLNRIVALDRDARTVTVESGVRYGELGRFLHAEGWALHNLASLPHISVAGATSTATHGSGDTNGSLATAVTALELVTGSGALVTLSRENDGDTFAGAVVGLGALGVVTRLTLRVEPTFGVRQDVYENLPLARLENEFDAVTSGGYSVSLFTDWRAPRFTQVWRKRRVGAEEVNTPAEPEWHGATLAACDLHPIAGISAENCTPQRGVSGPWHERLPHFRWQFTPSSGEELQSEYFVPRKYAFDALHAVAGLGERIAPLLQVSEVRTVAADDLWLSPCYRQGCVAVHFTWVQDWPAVRALLPVLEERLAPFDARPHWGKLSTTPPERLQTLFPRLPDFQALARRSDPDGKFRNAFLDTYVLGGA